MAKSTTSSRGRKAGKPHPDFPLFPHATGRWCKKIKGKFVYFGKVAEDPDGKKAIAQWIAEKDILLAGGDRVRPDGFSVRELCDRFMVSRRRKMEAGELADVSFADYFATCRRIIDFFGPQQSIARLVPSDFERFRSDMATGWSPVTLANEITRVRVVFGFASKNGHIPSAVGFGTEFSRPKKKVLRASRNAQQQANGKRCFDAAELKTIIDAATMPMKAMVLLAINCGYGNHDILRLPIKAIDLKKGWADFPRPKTGIPRRCPLWPETIAAIKQAMAERPKPRSNGDTELLFLTEHGRPWGARRITEVKADPENNREATLKRNMDDLVCKRFNALLTELDLKRHGVSFYAIRHSFETMGGGSRDQVAVDYLMGHADDSMAAAYREGIEDSRLQAVVDHVRTCVFPATFEQKKEG